MRLSQVFALFFLLVPTLALAADGAVPSPLKHPGWSFKDAREIPLQGGGRIKPLDSFAREISLFETGSRSFEGWDPVDMLFSQISSPDSWDSYPFIQVSREDVRRQLGLDDKRTRFTPHELMSNPVLAQYAVSASSQGQQVSAPIAVTPKADPREQEFKRVFERLGAFRRVVAGEAWTIVPQGATQPIGHGEAPWASLADSDKAGEPVRLGFVEMLRAYQRSDESRFSAAAARTRTAVESGVPHWSDTVRSRVAVETRYNLMRPFLAAWILYLIAALVWIIARTLGIETPPSTQATATAMDPASVEAAPERGHLSPRAARIWTGAALGLTFVAAACQIAGIAMRCYVAGRPPVTNMYESIIWVSLGQMVFAAILYAIHRQAIALLVACVLAVIGLIAADSAPAMMDPGLHPLVPVLRSNYWLTIHVLTITLGYAAFALTLGLANVSLWQFLRSDRPGAKVKIASMNQLTYRAMQFGVVLLAAGTILGGVWADYSWGRFWGWDPKEVWALIALLCYLTILHGRFAGWVGQFGFAAWSVISFLSVLMAWYGVNFVLGVGLHSYGFSSGGSTAIFSFVAAQLAWVGFVMYVYKRREATPKGAAVVPV